MRERERERNIYTFIMTPMLGPIVTILSGHLFLLFLLFSLYHGLQWKQS